MRERTLTARSTGPARRSSAVPARARRSVRRRRLVLAGLCAIAAAVAGYTIVRPLADDLLKEITLPLRHEDIIRQQARDKGLDPALVAAIIYRESRFRDVTSDAGAKGLMQILPATAEFIARKSGGTRFELRDLGNPQINIAYGCWYLRYLVQRYDGNTLAAVAAYNAGHDHVDAWGGSALTLADIRFPETAQYTREVLEKRDDYAREYRRELGL